MKLAQFAAFNGQKLIDQRVTEGFAENAGNIEAGERFGEGGRKLIKTDCGDFRRAQLLTRVGRGALPIGPRAPAGRSSAWIPTVPGWGWFAYFRFYAPTAAYSDRSWQLPDIRRIRG